MSKWPGTEVDVLCDHPECYEVATVNRPFKVKIYGRDEEFTMIEHCCERHAYSGDQGDETD